MKESEPITYTKSEISELTGCSPSDIGLIAKALKLDREDDFLQLQRDSIIEFADFAKDKKLTIQKAIAQFKPNQPREAPSSAEERNTPADFDTATLDTINLTLGDAGFNLIEVFKQQKQGTIDAVCDVLRQEAESFPYELALAVIEVIESLPAFQTLTFESYDDERFRHELQERFGVSEETPAQKFRRRLEARKNAGLLSSDS